ncbi:myb/SANT-like DNA-binding domain-containing protein 4, partial [Saccostrea cucullata]|uniref:myb/SANT-like DNA-binding domain-containing protein 4 n=1 Tax=Saccostrea cuccullata TaxID=36930 RepID=UPI002ED0FB70
TPAKPSSADIPVSSDVPEAVQDHPFSNSSVQITDDNLEKKRKITRPYSQKESDESLTLQGEILQIQRESLEVDKERLRMEKERLNIERRRLAMEEERF